MTLDAFLETAWNDHGDHPQEVADRLAAALHLVAAPAHIPPFARLATHVYGLAALEQLEAASVGALAIVAVGLVPVLLLPRAIAEGRAGGG